MNPKTVCVYHSIDLDGWMSAAIVKLATKDEPPVNFIGYNYGEPAPDLSDYDKVIMCDISFHKDEMEKLFDRLGENLIWIDHHISAIKSMFTEGERSIHPLGLQDTRFAACELTWKYFFPEQPMPEIVRLLGRYDCFGHKGTSEEKKVLEFQYGARTIISNYEQAYDKLTFCLQPSNNRDGFAKHEHFIWEQGESIYKFLCTEAKQSYKNGFVINFHDPVQTDKTYKFIAINKERFNPINFGIDYHADGYDGCACFYYNGTKWSFSLYNDNGKVDCSMICKSLGGGGHKGAAGFVTTNIGLYLPT
jgi:oligoribonuclease NrnB/cAMP/cGMP phosphodiesterase (DHH superfamily)